MHRGYIKLWRKIRDNPRMHDPDYMAAWAWCLIEATYCKKKSIFGGKEIELQPGQFTTGRRQFSELSGIQESKLERIFICFVNNGQIEQQTSNTNRLISICNWKEYQEYEQQMNNKRTTDEQQVNTPKELKKEKNEKNTTKPLWQINSDEGFAEYLKISEPAFDALLTDWNFISIRKEYFPGCCVKRTLCRMWEEFWGTKAGWENKRQAARGKPDYEMNWRSTIERNFKKSICYYGKNEIDDELTQIAVNKRVS